MQQAECLSQHAAFLVLKSRIAAAAAPETSFDGVKDDVPAPLIFIGQPAQNLPLIGASICPAACAQQAERKASSRTPAMKFIVLIAGEAKAEE